MATALERDEPRANYACGAVFALVAEKANSGDFFAFTRRLIDANRADRELTSAEWLAALEAPAARRAHSRCDPRARGEGLAGSEGRDRRAVEGARASRHVLDAKGVPQLQ